jgi:hypothetical protein
MANENPAKQAMDKILGIITPESAEAGASRPIMYSSRLPEAPQGGTITTTPTTTSAVGQSGPAFDPNAQQNAELAALRQRSTELASGLGLGGSTGGSASTGQKATPSWAIPQKFDPSKAMFNINSSMSKYPVLPTWSQRVRAEQAGHPYDFKNTTYQRPVVTKPVYMSADTAKMVQNPAYAADFADFQKQFGQVRTIPSNWRRIG